MSDIPPEEWKSPLEEITQPFIDLMHAPRALWGINLGYLIEGMVYFGMLVYLAMYFSDFVFKGVPDPDVHAHQMVMILTGGITLAMLVLGFVPDKVGVRRALLAAFTVMLIGRFLISAAPTLFKLQPQGLWSPLHVITLAGMLLVIVGYGMYQPAAYAGVRKFTTPKTAGMGFAMLYALMNLGGWLPTFAFLVRDEHYLGLGIPGTYWVYTGFTLVALICTAIILTPKTERDAIEWAKTETARIEAEEKENEKADESADPAEQDLLPPAESETEDRVRPHMWLFWLGAMLLLVFKGSAPYFYHPSESRIRWGLAALVFIAPLVVMLLPRKWHRRAIRYIAKHPLADAKFAFFIFALIPVQTLFTYNWLILPQYISRAFEGWVGEYFEIASNANPLLIFFAVPIITAITEKANVYNMMIIGTFVMAAPAFLLALGPHISTLAGYILIMTIGEAMWQPRFLQYAAEIAPEGRTGEYMGVAQFPWFLTKVLVPMIYSGWMIERYCPAEGAKHTEIMWFIFGCIAIVSPILLLMAKGWVGKHFQTTHAGN